MWRVDRRLNSKYDSLCSLSLHGSEVRSSKVLVADASSAPVGSSATIQAVSADETDVEVVMSVSGAMRALVLFCNAVGVKPSPFVTGHFVGMASVTTTLTTVARRLTLCCDRSEKRHFESALAFKAPAFVHAWSATTKQTVNSLMSEVGTKHGFFSDRRTAIGAQSVVKTMELLVGNLTAAVVILGNHLQTAIQRLHTGNSKIRARCLGKAQAEVQLNSLNCRDPELTWVEPTDALVDAAS